MCPVTSKTRIISKWNILLKRTASIPIHLNSSCLVGACSSEKSLCLRVMVSDCCCVGFSPKVGFSAPTWWTVEWVPLSSSDVCTLEGVFKQSWYYVFWFICACVFLCVSIIEFEDIKPNSVHMALQIPQYFLITTGEVMFSVTGLQFSYSQIQQQYTSPDWLKQHSHCAKIHGLDATWCELDIRYTNYRKIKHVGWGLDSVHWFLIG